MLKHKIAFAAALMTAVVVAGPTAFSAETVLRGASCFPQGSFFSKRFESFVEQVNAQGKGVVQINYVGGAPAIGTPFTLLQKMSQGVYDIGSCTGAYYQNVVPEADAWKLLEKSPADIRQNGGWALMEKIHREKNLLPLARVNYGMPFHLYLADGHKIDKPDLTGLHLRVAPIYTNFFKALGATTQTSNLAQIYTLMENGTVNGYGWPIAGLRPGWEKVTKYRVDPGFYDADIQIVANASSWDKLSNEARDLMSSIALKIEADSTANDPKASMMAAEKQSKQGFEVITFTGNEGKEWLTKARDAGWEGVVKQSPKYGPDLRKTFANE